MLRPAPVIPVTTTSSPAPSACPEKWWSDIRLSSISPVAVFTETVLPLDCSTASLMAIAVRWPMPGTWAISATVAARSLRNEPKCLSSVLRRTSPSPGTSSSRLSTIDLLRRERWWVIANRWASSRTRWRR